MNILKKLISFLKKPKLSDPFAPFYFSDFIGLLFITILVIIPYTLILGLAGADQFDHRMLEMMKNNKWMVAIFAIVFAPLLEEPIFRLHLNLKKSAIWWSLGLSVLMMGENWFPSAMLMAYLIYLLIRVYDRKPLSQKFVVYVSAVLFGLVHMINFKDFDYSHHFYWVPFLVGIQFWLGLVLSYIRMNYGIGWAIFFHGFYNAMLILPAVYFFEG